MNIFSDYRSTKSTFFYPRYRLESLKKGFRRHHLLLPLGTPTYLPQYPTALHCIGLSYDASEDDDDDGGSGDIGGGCWVGVSPPTRLHPTSA